jgi:hypothetical protein
MVSIVSPTLMNLAGLHGTGSELHIQKGNHLRIAHNPILGLPVGPFVLQRAFIGDSTLKDLKPRRDIIFRDASDRILTLPITVGKGDTIRATIVQGPALSCVWVVMTSSPIKQDDTRLPTRISRLPPRLMVSVDRTKATSRLDPAVLRDTVFDSIATTSDAMMANIPKSGDLVMRAYSASAGNGLALVGEREDAPYALGGSAIAEVEITGRGVITDMVWLAAQDLDKFDWATIDVLHLPHKDGRRYISVSDARKRCEKRVRTQAPKLAPLQETQGAIAPSAAPPFTDNDEMDRVDALASPLDNDLDQLIDGPALPLLASEIVQVTDEAGNPLATTPGEESNIEINHLGRVIQSTLDPGVGVWLGCKGLDTDDLSGTGTSIYRAIGFFRHPSSLGATSDILVGLPLGQIPLADRQLSAPTVKRMIEALAGGFLANEGHQLTGGLETANNYMVMSAVAVVSAAAVPSAPHAPTLLPTEHISWLPATPPDAVREANVPVKDVLIGATLAAEREQKLPGSFTQLNLAVAGTRWHTPLTLGLITDNNGVPLVNADQRQGVLADRAVSADDARFHVAQQDRFGRWSPFADVYAGPGPRPKPPRPVVQGNYNMPALADAGTSGGSFQLRVMLPEVDSLAPGSHPLSHGRLMFRHHGVAPAPFVEVPMADMDVAVGAAIEIDTSPAGTAPRRALPATVTGPILQPTEQRRMVITAVWIDTAGQQSAVSEPLKLLMTDPRPPAQIPIPEVLLYSSRPDATGLAWVERGWPLPAGTPPNYAAYYTDEVRLLAWLREEGRGAEAQTIADTTNRAARAGMFRAIQGQFPDFLFERLNDAINASVPGQRRLRHAVSGSSRVLNAYKIAVEAAASGARPSLTGLDTVFYGVPNSDPPPRPTIAVRHVESLVGEAALIAEATITVVAGVTAAVSARLYRTRGGPTNPLYAPVVAVIPLTPPDPVTGRQTAVFRDSGTAVVAPAATLTPFARYQWFADVQGGPESGSSVQGLWSLPSDPVGIPIVPASNPVTPIFDGFGGTSVAGGTQDLALRISHPAALTPTPLGNWTVKILRAEPGNDWSVMTAADILVAPVVIADSVAGPGGLTPLATQFRITLTDPLGRPSPSIDVMTS